MAEDPTTHRPLHVVRGEERSVLELGRPIPAWTDVALVLAVCVPFWAGLTWLVSTWL